MSLIAVVENDDLKLGDLVQVKYEEGDQWQNAYFYRFWTDGRIEVIPNGQTPQTWRNADGKQWCQLSDEDMTMELEGTFTRFNSSTYNFYRKIKEITDSGDIGNSDTYISHWGQARLASLIN